MEQISKEDIKHIEELYKLWDEYNTKNLFSKSAYWHNNMKDGLAEMITMIVWPIFNGLMPDAATTIMRCKELSQICFLHGYHAGRASMLEFEVGEDEDQVQNS